MEKCNQAMETGDAWFVFAFMGGIALIIAAAGLALYLMRKSA